MPLDVPPPDELERAGAEHVDEAAVRAYDSKSRFDPSDDLEELRRRGLDRDTTLIDIGAGTGAFALAAARAAGRVVAVDVSPAMVSSSGTSSSRSSCTRRLGSCRSGSPAPPRARRTAGHLRS